MNVVAEPLVSAVQISLTEPVRERVILAFRSLIPPLGTFFDRPIYYRVRGDTRLVRKAELGFAVGSEALPANGLSFRSLADAPALVIEIGREAEEPLDAIKRSIAHLESGVRVILSVDPAGETACIFRRDKMPEVIDLAGVMRIPDVLPGFAVPVKQFFG